MPLTNLSQKDQNRALDQLLFDIELPSQTRIEKVTKSHGPLVAQVMMAKHTRRFTPNDIVTQSCGSVVIGICCLNSTYSSLREYVSVVKSIFDRNAKRTRD